MKDLFKMLSHQLFKTALGLCILAIPATSFPTSQEPIYEYVVVGSGAGGGTVAASLARKGHTVLLLEAGGDHGSDILQQLPAISPVAAENEEMSWRFWIRHFRNETQGRRDSKFNYQLPDGSVYTGLDPPEGAEALGLYYPRGATVGGSTQVNAMSFQKAPDHDWNYIAELTGDESWSASAMEPYFVGIENCTYLPRGSEGHGFDGFANTNRNNVSYITSRPSVVEVLSNWARESEGIEVQDTDHLTQLLTRDTNHQDHHYTPGVYLDVSATDWMRRRSSAWNNIIDTIAAGYPLTLRTHSLATKVLLKEVHGEVRAVGVEYLEGEALYGADRRYNSTQTGTQQVAFARREVIVAGGAFNTPQLLKLSGVGPRQELEDLGIPVIVDLPGVGENLHDHSEGVFSLNASAPWENNAAAACNLELGLEDPCILEWQSSGTGPYGEAGAPTSVRFRSSYSETGLVDVWLFGTTNYLFRGFYPGYSNAIPSPNSWSMSMIKIHTPGQASTGSVTLRSTDPRDPPISNFDWLSGETGDRDVAALAEAAAFLEGSFGAVSEPHSPITRHQPPIGADVGQNIKDEAFGHHASSTCRMGTRDDPNACVDSRLRVLGVEGLRVVDASVFPFTPSAFPVLAVTMLGQKAADPISEDATA